ncbi:MAG: SRPBCC domain-containing protein [Candidatus Omnitrophica bacterium]|nr:SRPBCC domain-containing protein [Candidatus Omnitrophota bacterium]
MPAVKDKIKDFVLTRTLDAPRRIVWDAFTSPGQMKYWWGPKDYTVVVSRMDLHNGGSYLYCLRSPEGKEMWGKFLYREILPLDHIIAVDSFSNKNGGLTRHPMAPNWPLEMLSTFTFESKGSKTRFTVEWSPINPTEEERSTFEASHQAMTQGWTGTLDQLARYLRNPPIVIEQSIKAPVDRVWKAITHKEQMKEWFFDINTFKPESGFEFKFLAGPDKKQYLHLCKIIDVVDKRKLSYSWRYNKYKGDSLVTFELFNEIDSTKVRLTHEGLGTFPENNPDFARENFVQGWSSIIGTSLKNFAQT